MFDVAQLTLTFLTTTYHYHFIPTAYAYGLYGNYTLAFFLAGIPPIVAAVLMFNILRLQRTPSRSSFMQAENIANLRNNGFCERGEKLHLLTNGNVEASSAASTAAASSLNGGDSSPLKLRMTENSSSITDCETSSENASLLKVNGNQASIVPAGSATSQKAPSNAVTYA